MDCEKQRFCEIANCEKIAISQLTQFIFLSAGRNRNITQFDFLEGRNGEIGEKTFIAKFKFLSDFPSKFKMRKSQFFATFRNRNLILKVGSQFRN